MKVLLPLSIFLLLCSCEPQAKGKSADFPTQFEISEGSETATYEEVIEFYIRLAREFPEINVQTIGETDSGLPLQLVTYNPDSDFNFQKIGREKVILLINNGIHPGESDGIDATMLLFRDLALHKVKTPKNTVLATIPVYNVGGALNRNTTSRVNQNGPKSYGFRGNARNYDLNRDFIKSDTRNSRTFARIYHMVKPDIFVDTHVSNGADYQYTLTYISTQHNKLGEPLGNYLETRFIPGLKDSLLAAGWDLTPYVNVHGRPPDNGFDQFMDYPRYSTGYTALWNTLGIMVETHMLKAYDVRVKGTYQFLLGLLAMAEAEHDQIRKLREETRNHFETRRFYPIAWEVDTTANTLIEFKGYKADTIISSITGLPRLKYDRNSPYTMPIPYRNQYHAIDSVEIPKAYIIKKSWSDIISLLELNKITYRTFDRDSTALVESYIIDQYNTLGSPYEGHYLHYGTTVIKVKDTLEIKAGDFMVPTRQPGLRYLMETLEPSSVDSFFNWNFFDPVLQRKESFSAYVFEDVAANLLLEDTSLKMAFESKKESDRAFAADPEAQLEWLYIRSPYYENAHLQYPIYRLPASPKGSNMADAP